LDFFTQSENEYTKFFGAEDPDLSSFKAAGGKLITWHGLSDPAIMPQATINYRKQVENTMGGSSAVNEFYRLFMAPGGVHCAPGVGPTPKTQTAIEALVSWVEDGHAPDTLRASTNENIGNVITRDLCPYPLVARYNGTGDFHSPENFHCAKTFSSEP
jgi:feruloyl esterase